jgi:hypothetical protein
MNTGCQPLMVNEWQHLELFRKKNNYHSKDVLVLVDS